MRPIFTLPLHPFIISKLRQEGYLYCEDIFTNNYSIKCEVENIFPDLPKELWCDLQKSVLSDLPLRSALELLKDEKQVKKIITLSHEVDEILGGGINLGEITEFCGVPGSGKTQMCLQLCITVQLPRSFNGVEGESIFLDTNSGFSLERLKEMAISFHKNLLDAKCGYFDDYSKLLDSIHYMDISNNIELLALIEILEGFIKEHSRVKLIVIDSLTFPFLDSSSLSTRTYQICHIIRRLRKTAMKYNVAVVVTNQLTTKVIQQESKLVPALGENFAHAMSKRVILGCLKNSKFKAYTYKSSSLPERSAEFQVLTRGICDV